MNKKLAASAAILAAALASAGLSSCNEKGAPARKPEPAAQTANSVTAAKSDGNARNPEPAAPEGAVAAARTGDSEGADSVAKAKADETAAENPAPKDEPTAKILELDFEAARIRPAQFLDEETLRRGSIHAWSGMFLVGFSRDGKIAWLEERERDGVGETQPLFFVQDLVSDKVLFRLADNGEGEPDFSKTAAAGFSERMHAEIDAELARHKILPVRAEFGRLPYSGGGATVDVSVNVRDTGRMFNEFQRIIDYSCVAVDGGGRRKTVLERKDATLEGAVVCGFIKSPFEERLALVIGEEARGFEGCDLMYSFAGCAIDKGW